MTHDLLDAYFDAFARRPDVHVWSRAVEGVESPLELPGEARALLGRSTRFAWSFDPPAPGDVKPQGNGGCLWLHPGHGEGWLSSEQRWLSGVSSSLLVDYVVEEGLGLLVVDEGGTIADARPAFFDANDDALVRFESMAEYLRAGAARGFVWYWQNAHSFEARDLLERLHARSRPAGTDPHELARAIEASGTPGERARALVEWLGDDARLLVPRD